MTACCEKMSNCSVSESVRSASMSFDAVRFYSYCVFLLLWLAQHRLAKDVTMHA